MQLGMIGLGRMGANMVRRLQRSGHACVVYDRNSKAIAELTADGAQRVGVARRLRQAAAASRAPSG